MLAYQIFVYYCPIWCSRRAKIATGLTFGHFVYFHVLIVEFIRSKVQRSTILENFCCHTLLTLFALLRIKTSHKYFMNPLGRSFFCSLITISYIELHIPSMGHGVFGVEEVDVPLHPPYFEPVLSWTNLCMILRVPTSALWILWRDLFSVPSLPLVT